MNLLLLNQCYAPDPAPTGQFLRDLAVMMASRGHRVSVICSAWAYGTSTRFPARETLDGVEVVRVGGTHFGRRTLPGRILDYASFLLGAARRARHVHPRPDFCFALTTPPYVGLLASGVFRPSAIRHGHWLMDLYPDVMRAHGMIAERGILDRALSALTRRQLRHSALTVVLGPDMVSRATRYGPAIRALPLWGSPALTPWPADHPPALRASRGWKADDLVLMYSGNMGLGHRLSEFLAAADARRADAHVRWVFAGNGRRRGEVEALRQRVPEARVEILDGVEPDQLREHLATADVHLASLEPAWQGCMLPSKLQGIFAVGRPVIFVGASDNSAARWIADSGGGWVVAPGDTAGLLRAVEAARDPRVRRERGAAAARYARSHFDLKKNCGQMCDWISAAARGDELAL